MSTTSPPPILPNFFVKPSRTHVLFWLGLSLAVAAVIGIMQMQKAFGAEYVVQDDARQHIFWMQRFLDPALFPNDLIADYFQSVAPWGFTTLYQVPASFGVDPAWFNRVLPIFIWLLTTAYCFGASMQIFPVPVAGFLSATLLNLSTLQADDILSATPRAFTYPLFVAFLYYLMRRSLIPCWVTIVLQGMFYPQVMLVSAGILVLRLCSWEGRRPHFQGDRTDYILSGVGLGVAGAAILFYIGGGANTFGPVISLADALQMPEFWTDGRTRVFTNNPFDYWLLGNRSGLLPHLSRILKPFVIALGIFLPSLLKQPTRFPLATSVTNKIQTLNHTLLASIFLFFAAHAVLFKLHHPSRYTQHTFRIVMALSAGATLVILLDALFRHARQQGTWQKQLQAWGSALGLAVYLLIFPVGVELQRAIPPLEILLPNRILPAYVYGTYPQLYEFFAAQPKDTLIASLAKEVSNVPSFSRRSILTGWEYGIPYHMGYYQAFRERSRDLYKAHYSPDLQTVRQFTDQYGIDYWMVAQDAFTLKGIEKPWGYYFAEEKEAAIAALNQGQKPIVQQAIERCTVLNVGNFVVMPAACVVEDR